MSMRVYLPVEQPSPLSAQAVPFLKSLAGKDIVFISNWRSRNDEIEAVLREVLTTKYEVRSLVRFKVDHGRPEPDSKMLPLAGQYHAAIGAYGG